MTSVSPTTRRRLEIEGLRGLDGLGAVWLLVTGWAFYAGNTLVGYLLGGALTLVGLLVSTTDICIPSIIYKSIFGFPPRSRRR